MGITAVVERQREQVATTFDAVEEIEDVASGLPAEEDQTRLRAVAKSFLGTLPPVRASVAAELLNISTPTVRKWARLGMLHEVKVQWSRVLHVDAVHLHEVLHLVQDLRKAGKDNVEFFRHLRWAMEDRDLLASSDVQEGLKQLREGAERVEL
ncbi:hypothetical protein ACIGNX_27510 [Actinosynnema sp. NPDC053489]|uniref:hypothetical protein n=1 Tax=Actinosynnema sp. NPDC053489 TaxID=3363916 RepID=UPI0037C6DD58